MASAHRRTLWVRRQYRFNASSLSLQPRDISESG